MADVRLEPMNSLYLPRQITAFIHAAKEWHKIKFGSWHTSDQIRNFIFCPALEASLGSYYSLPGFMIPRHSSQLNHLAEHVGMVNFKISSAEKCLLRLLRRVFLFTHSFSLKSLVWV